jgi:hypothetical protein
MPLTQRRTRRLHRPRATFWRWPIPTAQQLTSYHPGVYSATPPTPISVKGGSGTGATVSTTWNPRAPTYAGIAVVDAENVAITNNASSNSQGNTAQRYRIALLQQLTGPLHVTMSGEHACRQFSCFGVTGNAGWRTPTMRTWRREVKLKTLSLGNDE